MAKQLKNPIGYEIQLDDDQKEVKESIINNQIVVVTGPAGCGKTTCVIQTAIDLFFKKEISKIYITRPIVEVGKSLGFLPGELDQKYNPYIEPILDTMFSCYKDKEKLKKHLENGDFQGYPISYVRGKNMSDLLIVDESQNLSELEVRALCTRLTPTGRIIFTRISKRKPTFFRCWMNLRFLNIFKIFR